jgi:hypothetical protein
LLLLLLLLLAAAAAAEKNKSRKLEIDFLLSFSLLEIENEE